MLYMLLICYDPTVPPDPSEQNLQPEHAKLERELRQRGVYISGAGLWPVENGKTVRHERGKILTTDGPFAETKEAIGGYFIVDCDEQEAIGYAKRIRVEKRGWIQVRPIALWHPNFDRIAAMREAAEPARKEAR